MRLIQTSRPFSHYSMKCLKVTSMLFAMTYVLALLIQFLPESVFKGDVLWFARAQHLLSSMAGIVFFMNLGFLARKHSSQKTSPMKMFSILCFAGALVQVLHFITVLPQAFISIESSFQLARWSALLDSILWFVFPLSCVFAIPVLMHRASHSRMSPSSF